MFPTLLPSAAQAAALVWLLALHVVADWMLQTDWMALHKRSLRHPAAWVHSSIHLASVALFFPWTIALFVAVTHLLIDTRVPTHWWMRVVKGMPPGSPMFMRLEIPMDQVLHIVVLIVAVVVFL
jgi:hypothetical protein